MKRRVLFDQLIEAARRVFDRVELAGGDFRGGSCRLRDERCLFLNRNADLDNNLRIIATELAGERADEIYLLPKIRDAIDRYSEI